MAGGSEDDGGPGTLLLPLIAFLELLDDILPPLVVLVICASILVRLEGGGARPMESAVPVSCWCDLAEREDC